MGGGRDRGRWRCWLWLAMTALYAARGAVAPTVPKDANADTFNVISVENMDALLRLRLGPDLLPLNGSEGVDGSSRTRRATGMLCGQGQPACHCEPTAGKWLIASCAFSKQEVRNYPYFAKLKIYVKKKWTLMICTIPLTLGGGSRQSQLFQPLAINGITSCRPSDILVQDSATGRLVCEPHSDNITITFDSQHPLSNNGRHILSNILSDQINECPIYTTSKINSQTYQSNSDKAQCQNLPLARHFL